MLDLAGLFQTNLSLRDRDQDKEQFPYVDVRFKTISNVDTKAQAKLSRKWH